MRVKIAALPHNSTKAVIASAVIHVGAGEVMLRF